jgi:hypothetical protein
MNTARSTGTFRMVAISFLLAAVVVVLFGTMMPNEASAFKAKAKGVSVEKRVQGQSDLCWAGGGTTTVSTSSVFSNMTTTTCSGGKQDGMKCTNTTNSTSCDMPRIVVLGDSKLAAIIASTSVFGSEPANAPEDDTDVIDQGTVIEDAPAIASEPSSTPELDIEEIDEGAVTNDAPEVAPEPTATPEGAKGLDETVVSEEPLTVDPGTEGDATSGGKVVNVDVALGDGSSLPSLEVNEQQ